MSNNLQLSEGDWRDLIMEACSRIVEAKRDIFAISNTPYEDWQNADTRMHVDSKLFAKAFVKAVKKFNRRENEVWYDREKDERVSADPEKLRKKFKREVVTFSEREAYKYAAKVIYEQASKEKVAPTPTLVETNEQPDDLDIPDGEELD